jgi:hypothetical protein
VALPLRLNSLQNLFPMVILVFVIKLLIQTKKLSKTLTFKDEKTLVIKGFGYDGTGPDSFFLAGTSEKISSDGIILPYPFQGKFYDYEDKKVPLLERSFSDEKIV